MMLRKLLVTAPFFALSSTTTNALLPNAPKPPSPSPLHANQGRRSFVSSAFVGSATAILTSRPQTADAKWFWEAEPEYFDYAIFKTMLESSQLKQVQFGTDGTSLSCLDTNDVEHLLVDIPDEKSLLKELYNREVIVELQEVHFEKKMNAVSWMRDLVGAGDDITEEEMYEYRGYKTHRSNIPERSYVPSNLIMGYDMSRKLK